MKMVEFASSSGGVGECTSSKFNSIERSAFRILCLRPILKKLIQCLKGGVKYLAHKQSQFYCDVT